MRSIIYPFPVILFITMIISSCEIVNENKEQPVVTGKVINSSACKNDFKTTSEDINTPDTLSCVEYSFDTEKNSLTLKHINSGFNCCPDSLYCKIELHGDTILIREYEKSALCHCNCLYDLDIAINNVDIKKYQVKFIEPYSADMEKLIFEIDPADNPDGSYCVTRKLYPWGIYSTND